MALVRCSKCNKVIDDKVKTCPNCRIPVSGGNLEVKIAFEKRVKEYKAHGYKLVKRSGNLVEMRKGNFIIYSIIIFCITILLNLLDIRYLQPYDLIFSIFLIVFSYITDKNTSKVVISITKEGVIKETGKFLKK